MKRLVFIVVVVLSACTKSCESKEAAASKASVSSAPAPTGPALPPLDDACSVDGDCAYSFMYLVDGKCCGGSCGARPASQAYLKEVDQACSTLGFAEANCPSKKCAALPRLVCVEGHCAPAR